MNVAQAMEAMYPQRSAVAEWHRKRGSFTERNKHETDRARAAERKRDHQETREAEMDRARRKRAGKVLRKEIRRKGNPRVKRTPRLKVYERDEWRCVTCNIEGTEETLSLDHIRPWSRGGSNAQANLQTMCRRCNQKKGRTWDGESGHAAPMFA